MNIEGKFLAASGLILILCSILMAFPEMILPAEDSQIIITGYDTLNINRAPPLSAPFCGDGRCNSDENFTTCFEDCHCGNTICDSNENYTSCAVDGCLCGNDVCDEDEDYLNCPSECSCKNGICDSNENYTTCPYDCYCPKGPCIPGVNCDAPHMISCSYPNAYSINCSLCHYKSCASGWMEATCYLDNITYGFIKDENTGMCFTGILCGTCPSFSDSVQCPYGCENTKCLTTNKTVTTTTSNKTNATNCTEDWHCAYGECINGIQRRGTCIDYEFCGTKEDLPPISRKCISSTKICVQNWTCTNWTQCLNGQQRKSCNDENTCGNMSGKPKESQTCSSPAPSINASTAVPAPSTRGSSTGVILSVSSLTLIGAAIIYLVIRKIKIKKLVGQFNDILKKARVSMQSGDSAAAKNSYKVFRESLNQSQGKIPKKHLARLTDEGMKLYNELIKSSGL
ncbi:MAG: hypothetical protein KKE23_01530 [Nanoarchaeota archaeon]|nr:hypothetical protein [Nanoarchaeota archaeon]